MKYIFEETGVAGGRVERRGMREGIKRKEQKGGEIGEAEALDRKKSNEKLNGGADHFMKLVLEQEMMKHNRS